jgi:hypothetical protein
VAKPNSSVQVNEATTPGAKLAMYEFPDPNPEEGCEDGKLQSEAVTLTTGRGEELVGPQPPSRSVPVVVSDQPEKLHNGEEKVVGQEAVMLLDENHARKTALVQNLGCANIRVGVRHVKPTTGLRLRPNAIEIFTVPDVYLGEIWAIAEGDVDSTAFVQETTGRYRYRHHPHHPHHGHDCDPDCDLDHDEDDRESDEVH